MPDTLLDHAATAPPTTAETAPEATPEAAPDAPPGSPPGSPPGPPPGPPEGLPEKFWDEDAGEIRADALVKSYKSLEQRLGALAGRQVPDSPDDYEIKAPDPLITPEPTVNARLHAAGFSQEQAQAVYDMAAEYLLPMVSEMAAEFHSQGEVDRLAHKFGGEDRWRETAAQLKQWGRSKFPDEVYTALAGTYEGILTMHKMMSDGEPGLIEGAGRAGGETGETGLRRMMADPRYWRDHDPEFVGRVQDGFRRLFPD